MQHDLKEGEFYSRGKYDIDGQIYHVLQKQNCGVYKCSHRFVGQTVEEVLQRVLLPTDTFDEANNTITREVVYPNLYEPRKYIMNKTEGEGFIQLTSDTSEPMKTPQNAYLNQRCEVSKDSVGEGLTLTIHQYHDPGGIPSFEADKNGPSDVANLVYRLISNTDIVKGKYGASLGESLLPRFIRSIHDSKDFKPWKQLWVPAIRTEVKIWKSVRKTTPHPAYRMSARLQGTLKDFSNLHRAMQEHGSNAQKYIFPETTSQAVIATDGPISMTRMAKKIAPWPFKQREYMMMTLSGWALDNTLYCPFRSVPVEAHPMGGKWACRGIVYEMGFACQPMGKDEIQVTHLFHVDPIGVPRGFFELWVEGCPDRFGRIQELLWDKSKW